MYFKKLFFQRPGTHPFHPTTRETEAGDLRVEATTKFQASQFQRERGREWGAEQVARPTPAVPETALSASGAANRKGPPCPRKGHFPGAV